MIPDSLAPGIVIRATDKTSARESGDEAIPVPSRAKAVWLRFQAYHFLFLDWNHQDIFHIMYRRVEKPATLLFHHVAKLFVFIRLTLQMAHDSPSKFSPYLSRGASSAINWKGFIEVFLENDGGTTKHDKNCAFFLRLRRCLTSSGTFRPGRPILPTGSRTGQFGWRLVQRFGWRFQIGTEHIYGLVSKATKWDKTTILYSTGNLLLGR